MEGFFIEMILKIVTSSSIKYFNKLKSCNSDNELKGFLMRINKLNYKKIFLITLLSLNVNTLNVMAEEKNITPNQTQTISFPYKIYPLSGSLNQNPVFNSNSPEVVKSEGILLSTFPSVDKANPPAHLNRSFKGKFDIFTHHIAVERAEKDLTTLYQGILLYNPSDKPIKIKVISSATYNSQPDAPFKKMNDLIENDDALNYAGPGDRISQDIIRDKSFLLDREIIIKSRDYYLLMNQSIPIETLTPPVNGRTSLFKLESDSDVYIADLALYKKKYLFWSKEPEINDWIDILKKGNLSEKRDKTPTPIDQPRVKGQPFIYGRVAGVDIGNKWTAKITNNESTFDLPETNNGFSYALNTVYANTLGTNQNQSAIMEKRYDDTAYQAHANYGITYQIEIPLYNNSDYPKNVDISFDTPLRIGENKPNDRIDFNASPPEKIAFRGEFKIEYKDSNGNVQEKFVHVVQRFGQKGEPLLSILLDSKQLNKVTITYIYPADSTPPHVLSISTR